MEKLKSISHRARSRYINLTLAASSFLFIFFIVEAGFRYGAYLDDKKILSDKLISNISHRDGSTVGLNEIIKLSNNKDVIYEIKPNLKVNVEDTWKNTLTGKILATKIYSLRTNADGIRCSWEECVEHIESNDDNVVRIIGIGDSIMYGDGVKYKETYMSRLQQRLSASFTDVKWDTINLAVFGYNTAMEVAYLNDKGLKYNPDIVIVGYCMNDYNMPNFIRNKQQYFILRKSYLLEFIFDRLKIIERKVKSKNEFQLTDISIDDPEKVPSEYKHMVGWEGYAKSMRLLQERSEENDFEVVVVFFTSFFGSSGKDKKAREFSKELGFHIIDIDPLVDNYMAENNIITFLGSKLSINKYDPHPSVLLHDMASEVIYRQLIEQGLIDKALRAKMH